MIMMMMRIMMICWTLMKMMIIHLLHPLEVPTPWMNQRKNIDEIELLSPLINFTSWKEHLKNHITPMYTVGKKLDDELSIK